MKFLLFITFVVLAFCFTRARHRRTRAIVWLLIGSSLGPYLLDSTSLLSQARALLQSNPNDDQIEVPSAQAGLFAQDAMFIEYPAGTRILATRPEWGGSLQGLTLFYTMEYGELIMSCSSVKSDDAANRASFSFRSKGSNTNTLRVEFMGKSRDFSATLEPSTTTDPLPLRLLTVKGDQARELVRMLSDLPFPGIAYLSILDQDKKEESVLRLFTMGTVNPKSDIEHARFPQPRSNPLSVMAKFCKRQKEQR